MIVLLLVLAALVLAAGAVALYLIVSERRRHEAVESENARLLREAAEREAERSRLSGQVISAEQDERRRIALFLHDGPVQSLSGIALMLDAARHFAERGEAGQAGEVVAGALERHRQTIRELRDLSFNLEPVVLRDRGFGTAVRALADQLRLASEAGIELEVDVDAAEQMAESAQAALYQIIREALNQGILRGPPTRVSVRVEQREDGAAELVISDDAPGERRRRSFDALGERARTLSGTLTAEGGPDGGTTVRVVLPAYVAQP